jgi:CubicO group peptidase (beta-lactamase class C family)
MFQLYPMQIRKLIIRTLLLILFVTLAYGIFYAWQAFPIISGYGAKNLCSCVLLAGRNPDDVLNNELGEFPLRLGSFSVDYNDSTAIGSVFGFAKRKAIFRRGMGCSLLVELAENEFKTKEQQLPQPPLVDQDTINWPQGNSNADTLLSTINTTKLNQTLDSAFAEPGQKKLRRTRAVVVVYDGKIIAERYAPGFTKDSKLIGWSMTKSITNALVGILTRQGKLNLEEPAPIEAWKNDSRSKITLNDLMHASSGLAWEENYAGPSGATNMLFKKKDMGLFAAEAPLVHEPGKVFYYSSGTTNIIARIVRETVGDDLYYKFPYEELFYKIGLLNTVLEADAGGTFVGSSYSFGTARDWARFGLLYLNDGLWNGERILPEGWLSYTTTPAPGADRGQYGAQFWLNAGAPGNIDNRLYPDVPTDLFWADGFEGQNVFIIPSKKLVLVKLSLSQGDYLDDNKFLKEIIETLPY